MIKRKGRQVWCKQEAAMQHPQVFICRCPIHETLNRKSKGKVAT